MPPEIDIYWRLIAENAAHETFMGLPQGAMDQANLLSPDHPMSVTGSEYINKILGRFYQAAGQPFTPGDFHVVVSADQDFNLGITPPESGKKPTIMVSLGALTSGHSEDRLAGVIAHELSHKRLREFVSLGEVGKGEEMLADVRAAYLLDKAGYQRDALLELSRHFQGLAHDEAALDPHGSKKAYLKILTDEHPSWDQRVRRLEDVKSYLDRTRGDQKIQNGEMAKETPIPEPIVAQAKAAKHQTLMERFLKINKFHEQDSTNQLRILTELIEANKDKKLSASVPDGINSIVGLMTLDTANPDQMRAMHRLADAMIDVSNKSASMNGKEIRLPNSYGEAYALLEENYAYTLHDQNPGAFKKRNSYLLGNAERLHNAVNDFVYAASPEQAVNAAKIINDIAPHYFTPEGNYANFDIGHYKGRRDSKAHGQEVYFIPEQAPNFGLPSVSDVKEALASGSVLQPVWEEHVRLAQHLSGADAIAMWNAIYLTGGHHDPRVKAAVTEDLRGKARISSYSGAGGHIDPAREFMYESDGTIVGHNGIWPDYISYDLQQREMLRKQEAELKSANWGQLKNDFWGFVATHRDALAPPIFSIQNETAPYLSLNNKAPFVEEFLRHIEKGMADGSINRSDVRFFLTGNNGDAKASASIMEMTDHDYRYPTMGISDQAVLDNGGHFTLPILIERQGARIGQYAGQRSFNNKRDNKRYGDSAIAVTHPYIDFIFKQSSDLIDIPSRITFAGLINTVDPDADKETKFRDRRIIDFYRSLDIDQHISASQALALMNRPDLVSLQSNEHFTNVQTLAVLDAIVRDNPVLTTQELVYLNQLRANNMGIQKWWGLFQSETMSIFPDAVKRFYEHTAATDPNISQLIDIYHTLSSAAVLGDEAYSVFDLSPDSKVGFETLIRQKFEKITDPAEHGRVAEAFLHKRTLNATMTHIKQWYDQKTYKWEQHLEDTPLKFSGKIINPTLRQEFTEAYVRQVSMQLGQDDGTPAYRIQLEKAVERVIANTDTMIAADTLSRVATSIHAQSDNALYIRDEIMRTGISAALEKPWQAAMGEIVIQGINDSDTVRMATLDFLTSPLNQASLDRFYERLSHTPGRHIEDAFGRENALMIRGGQKLSFQGKVADLHTNLWSLPLEARAAALSDLLYPANVTDPNANKLNTQLAEHLGTPFNKKVSPELNALLANANPPGTTGPSATLDRTFAPEEAKNNVEARRFVQAYIKSLPSGEQRLILSAMVAARVPDGNAQSLGQTIRQAMSAAGPPGDKLLQAIHSYPGISDEFKAELGDPKSKASPLQRWQIIELLQHEGLLTEENARSRGLAPVKHVGGVLGSGSYGVTVELERADGRKTAVTLLREHAAARSEREFNAMRKGAEELIAESPDYKPIGGMVNQAARSSVIETDMALAREQAEIAKSLYDGMSIRVDGETFTFSTAEWLGHGPGYKETEIISGEHFNDLPVNTPEAVAHKERVATAMLSAEWYLMMRGGPFDHDRHGAQQRIDGKKIGLFDFGGMSLKPMTHEQKILFGKWLGEMMVARQNQPDLPKAMRAATEKYSITEENKTFLGSIERALLAQQDYMKVLEGGNRMPDILASIVATGDFDPAVYGGLREGLGIFGRQGFDAVLEGASKNRAIDIDPASGLERHGRAIANLQEEGKSALNEYKKGAAYAAEANYRGGRIAARVGGAMAIMDLYNNRIGKVSQAIEAGDYGQAIHETNIGGLAFGSAAADVWSLTRIAGAQIAEKASLPLAVGYGLYEGTMGLAEGNQKRAADGFGGTSGAIAFGMGAARILQYSRLGPWGIATVTLGAGIYGFNQGSSIANNAAILFIDKNGKALNGSQMYQQLNAFMDDANLTYQEDPAAYRLSILGVGIVPADSSLPGKVYKVNGNSHIDGTKYPAAYTLYQQINRSLQEQGMNVVDAEKKAISLLHTETYQRLLDDADPFLYERPYNPLESSELAQHAGREALALQQMLKENVIGLHAASKLKTAYPIHAYAMLNNIYKISTDGQSESPISMLLRERHKKLFNGITVDNEGKVTFSSEATDKRLEAFLNDANALITKGELQLTEKELADITNASFDTPEENKIFTSLVVGLQEKGIKINDVIALQIIQTRSILAHKGNALDAKQNPDDAKQLATTVNALQAIVSTKEQADDMVRGMKAWKQIQGEKLNSGQGTFGAPVDRIESPILKTENILKAVQATSLQVEEAREIEPRGSQELTAQKPDKEISTQRALIP